MRTLPTFFGVLELLLEAGVTTVAAAATYVQRHNAFVRLSLDAPRIEVDTAHGYDPGLDEIVKFVNSDGSGNGYTRRAEVS